MLIEIENRLPPIKFCKTASGEYFVRHLLAVDVDYNIQQLLRIFTHGKTGYKLWFLNRKKKVNIIDKAYYNADDKNIYLQVVLDVYGAKQVTAMSLDRFLYLVEIGDFTISNKHFNEIYMSNFYNSKYVLNMN